MLNKQRPEPFDVTTGDDLDFHTMFHTLQGEGPFTGVPSIFIRLAGCNLQCPGCDTEYTKGRQRLTVARIMIMVRDLLAQHPKTRLIVITGGEPTRQNIGPLIGVLIRSGLRVQVESNGVLPMPQSVLTEYVIPAHPHFTWVVSPKTSRVHHTTRRANVFKYVLEATSIDPSDGLPLLALGHKAAPRVARPHDDFRGDIYVNPMDEQDAVSNNENLIACRDSALKFGYRCGIQAHKLWDLP